MVWKCIIDLALAALDQAMETCEVPAELRSSLEEQFRFELEYRIFSEPRAMGDLTTQPLTVS